MNNYYNLGKVNKLNAIYNIIIGQRSNGKTYSTIKQGIENYFKNSEKFAYLRRFDEDITPKNITNLFYPHYELIKKLSKGEFDSVRYEKREFVLYNSDSEEKGKTICKCFSLNNWERTKGADNGFFKYIIFDEFITRSYYLTNEFVIFTNLLSSLIRDRDGSIIYMLANTVNQYCPYFSEMGITRISELKQGEVRIYTYGNSDLTVAVHYSAEKGNTKKICKYFAFDNPQLEMITNGKWELKNYPHAPFKIVNTDIKLKFYIFFNEEVIAGNIIQKNTDLFIFFNPQTKTQKLELKNKIVYSFKPSTNLLHCQNITEINCTTQKIINDLIKNNRMFFSDNMTGETVRNWLITQKNTNNSIMS